MFTVNEYFNGNVKSFVFDADGDNATVGVMAVGEYEFNTNTIEHMTLISGLMSVLLPGDTKWRKIERNKMFIVEANASFNVRIDQECAYLCVYKA